LSFIYLERRAGLQHLGTDLINSLASGTAQYGVRDQNDTKKTRRNPRHRHDQLLHRPETDAALTSRFDPNVARKQRQKLVLKMEDLLLGRPLANRRR